MPQREKHRTLAHVDYARMRTEADEFFGTEDRFGPTGQPA